MAATYHSPWLTLRDQLRSIMEDTDTTSPLVQDGEYDDFVSTFGEREGAAQIADKIAKIFARRVSQFSQAGAEQVQWLRERVTVYTKLAADIRSGAVAINGNSSGSVAVLPNTVNACENKVYDEFGVWPR